MGATTSSYSVSNFPGFSSSDKRNFVFWAKNNGETLSDSNLYFAVTTKGELLARSAHLTGTINATGGKIGDFTIAKNSHNKYYLNAKDETSQRRVYLTPDPDVNYALAIGTDNNFAFTVTPAGKLSATGVDIAGKITATSGSFEGKITATSGSFNGKITASEGTIGKWTINEKNISTKSGQVLLQSATSDSTKVILIKNSSGTEKFSVTAAGDLYASSGTITGSVSISSACIPNLSAGKITSGTMSAERISASTTGGATKTASLSWRRLSFITGLKWKDTSHSVLQYTWGSYDFLTGTDRSSTGGPTPVGTG